MSFFGGNELHGGIPAPHREERMGQLVLHGEIAARSPRVEAPAPDGVVEAVEMISAGIEKLWATGLDPNSCLEAQGLIRETERAARQMDAARVGVFDGIHRTGVYTEDGHSSPRAFVRHQADLTNRDALGLAKCAQALRDLPGFSAAFTAGEIGTAQVHRMALAYSNARIREHLVESEALFLAHAKAQSSRWFDGFVTDWVRIVDEDGAAQDSEKGHRNRRFGLSQDYEGNWRVTGLGGSLAGAEVQEIFSQYVRAELADDWEAAKAENREDAAFADLPRTGAQRSWDAFEAMAKAAAATPADSTRPTTTTNIVLDSKTFERTLSRLLGTDIGLFDDADDDDDIDDDMAEGDEHDQDHDSETDDVDAEDCGAENCDGEDCEAEDFEAANSEADDLETQDPTEGFAARTLNGNRINPVDATIAALTGHIRRAVIGSDSVTIDLGRMQRLFTGSSRMAVWISDTECFHPSCTRHGTHLEIDHTEEWAGKSGETNPANGGPACKYHNLWKQRTGHRVWRDPDGKWHTYRPDGTEII